MVKRRSSAKRAAKPAVRYRDTKTGHFVRKSTWRRSRAHNGFRYKREKVAVPTQKAFRKPVRPAPPPEIPREFLAHADQFFGEEGDEGGEEEESDLYTQEAS